jgi:hypothetical protein
MNACDGCGKDRRIYLRGPDDMGFCFLCVKEGERAEAKMCPCGELVRCANPAICPHAR